MGSFLDKPKTDKETARSEGLGLRAGVSAMQGWRVDMEVRAIFAVFVFVDLIAQSPDGVRCDPNH